MISDEELLRFLDAEPPAWIVTRTRRLARELRLRVARQRAASGRTVSETPPIRSLGDWFLELGDAVLTREVEAGVAPTAPTNPPGRILLSPAAEQLLWERVISSAPGDLPGALLDLPSLATTAGQAWERVCHWGEPPWAGPLSEDVEAFRGWLSDFRARLDELGLVTAAQLPALVAEALDAGELDDLRPETAVVLGFERREPSLDRLLRSLESRGTSVVHRDAVDPSAASRPRVLRAASRSVEIRTVASRIRARLLEQPDLRVAVLAPDLPSYAALVERIFEEELDPAAVVSTDGSSARRFDFAKAPMLADYPLAATALDLLALGDAPLAFEDVSRVLLSEYPRAAGEEAEERRVLRGALETRLRRSRNARVLLARGGASVVAEARGSHRSELAELAGCLETVARRQAANREIRRSPDGWRREWVERLNVLGWPGTLADAGEGLVFRRWRDAMDELAALEVLEPSMSEPQALERLRAICSAMPVQPASEGLSVKVLGLLDAAGLEFDLVFVVGMTATAFPAAPRPNPLLPVAWQRAQPGMPRASVEGEKELADTVWARLLGCSAEVVVLWPARGDSEEENTASSVVADLEGQEVEAEEGLPWWLAAATASRPREPRPDDVPGLPMVRTGGTSILSRQSSCPFYAFAATRLAAERLPSVQPQPDRARRGTLVHQALQVAYGKIPSATDLAGLSAANIADVARDAAREVLARDKVFFEDSADLEEAATVWLEELVAAWMLHERDARDGDWTVESMEKKFELAFPSGVADPLHLRFRPDRIDRVGDGIVVLDFKTSGTAKKKGLWAGDRPDDPQLPLYLTLLEQEGHRVDALAFANLTARDRCSFDGMAAVEMATGLGPPSTRQKTFPPSFPDAVATMRSSVAALARDYLAGQAQVDPKKPAVCAYCGSQALCRVVESGVADEESEDEQGDPT